MIVVNRGLIVTNVENLDVSVIWESNSDPENPYRAEIEDEQRLLRLNDFPDEHLYTLLVNGAAVADFDDWPVNWVRPEELPANSGLIGVSFNRG
ncbi:MAG: hypothetical protein JMDDDDMK_02921 [Acidobacteria bacterium]|nr:hypothetical protein [Acidobacteriota bacterium]